MAVKTTRKVTQPTKPPVREDATIRDTFADDFVGLYAIGPNFHLTFASRRPIEPGKPDLARHVSARLVLPLDTMVELYNSLQAAVGRLENSGVIKRGSSAG